MTSSLRPACVFAWLLLASIAGAQPPAPDLLRDPIREPQRETTRGKVLLLDNDRILEGDIDRVNGQYRIRRSVGELWIPQNRAKKLCKDLEEALEVMKSQANLKDADERLRLARWCHINGLKKQALDEAKVSLDMRPEHAESLGLVQMLQRLAISSSPAMATQHTPPLPSFTTPQPPQASQTPRSDRLPIDVSAESLAVFSTRVQPILMNTCVSCHSQGRGGGFQLIRSGDGNSRIATQTNLNASLDYINVDKPVLSPLLLKSAVAHGGAGQPPLKGRQSIPFQTLQAWVDQVVAGNPHLKEIRRAETPPASSPSTSAKKDYFNEVFAPERTTELPPTPLVPLSALPSPPSVPPSVPTTPKLGPGPRGPSGIANRPDEISTRPTPSLPTTPTPNPIVPAPTVPPTTQPIAPPMAQPMPRDPFDPAEFNSRPKS